MNNNSNFDIYFDFNAEDLYLVQSISQHFRNRGYSTFDRSVDELPPAPEFALSEQDALAASKVMIAVLTENSVDDPVFQQVTAMANAAGKPVFVLRFDDVEIPPMLADHRYYDCSRSQLAHSLARIRPIEK